MTVLMALGMWGMGLGLIPEGCLQGPIADSIGLTEKQREQIEDIIYQYRQSMVELRAQIQSKRMELERLFWTGGSDSEIKSLVSQLSNLQAQAAEKRVEMMLSIRKLLNSEQLKKLRRMVKTKHHRWHITPQRRARRGPPH